MKLYNHSFSLVQILLITFSFVKSNDWTKNDDYNYDFDDEDEQRVQKRRENFDIGIALPWLLTTRYSLATIPKQILVATTQTNYYVCRAPLNGTRIKIVGKLHYPTQVCIVPTTKIESVHVSKLSSFPIEKRWAVFEVLTNPLNYNLMFVKTSARQGTTFKANDQILPARPVLAEFPGTSGFANRNVGFGKRGKAYSPPFIAYIDHYVPYSGVVQEVSENATLAFYYGLLNVQGIIDIRVLAVLNTKKPTKFNYLQVIN